MAKTSDIKSSLDDITTKFSTKPGGRVIDLSQGLCINMQNNAVAGAWIDKVSGIQFTLSTGASVTNELFSGITYATTNAVLLKGRASLPVVSASILSYAHEFTLSFWVKNPSTALNDNNPISGSFIMSSGSYGATFCGVSLADRMTHFFTGSVPGVGSPSKVGVRAGSTNYNIGDSWFEQSARTGIPSIYKFRESQSTFAGAPNPEYPQWNPQDWRMVTIVNRPAKNKVEDTTSVLAQTSKTGDEGRLETWVNGVLVNQNPPMESLPRGWAILFREDYGQGITNPSGSYAWFNNAGYGVVAQADCSLILKGNTSGGTQFYQFAAWDRDLSGNEIKSLYEGTRFGVYTSFDTSWSVTPRSAIYSKERPPLLNETSMLSNGGAGSKNLASFMDKSTTNSLKDTAYFYNSDTSNVIEGNFLVDDEMGLGKFDEWQPRGGFQGQAPPFRDEKDESSVVDDPEFDMPEGSSVVRISIPNVGSQAVGGFAGRYFKHFTEAGNDDFQSQGVGASVGPIDPGATVGCRGSGFLYYSPARKSWIEKRYDSSTSKFREPDATSTYYQANNIVHHTPTLTPNNYGTKIYNSTTGQNGTNSIMSQFSWSPQMGYYLPFEEHRNLIGYQKIGWPTSLFNAPNSPRYHGFDEETIKMKDYIDAPFMVKKIVVEIPVKAYRRFRNYTDFPILGGLNYAFPPSRTNKSAQYAQYVTNKKDIDNYVFFLYRQSRTSKVKDSIDDRTSSKRFIIASASLCFYNSQTFGKAEDDDLTVSPIGTSFGFKEIANSATVDGDGSKLTFSSSPTHTPAFSYDWNVGRTATGEKFYQERVKFNMLPAVCPRQFVSPSLLPFSASVDNITLLSPPYFSQFQFQSGSWMGPLNPNGSVYTTLVSNFWFGGTTNPAYVNTGLYDTAGLFGTEATPLGGVDVVAPMGPALSLVNRFLQISDPSPGAFDSFSYTTSSLVISSWRNLGSGRVTTFGATNVIDTQTNLGSNYGPTSERYQIPVDPRSVNVPTVAPGARSFPISLTSVLSGSATGDSLYAIQYCMNIAGPPQVSPLSQQIYSPYILMPDDELILGLDAGTFGPPDQSPSTSLTSSLKDAYRLAMADSWMQVMTGDAEIKLVGEYIRDGSPLFASRASNSTNGITSPIGMYQITDDFRSRTIQELSGTLFDRVMEGSPGVLGVTDGTRRIGASLASRRNLGSSRSANYFFKISDDSRTWLDETAFGYNNSNSSWSATSGISVTVDSSTPRRGNDSFIFSPKHFGHSSDLYGSSPNRLYLKGDTTQTGEESPPVKVIYVNPTGSNLARNPDAMYNGPLNTDTVDFFSVKYSSGSWAGESKNRTSTVTSRFIDRQNEDDLVG